MVDFYDHFDGDIDKLVKEIVFGVPVSNIPTEPMIFDEIIEKMEREYSSKIVWTGYKKPFTVIFIKSN